MTISITAPVGSVIAGSSFLAGGALSGYSATPTLQYVDDPVMPPPSSIVVSESGTTLAVAFHASAGIAYKALTSPSVSTKNYSFIHPAIAVGSHTMVVTDGTTAAELSYKAVVGPDQAAARVALQQPWKATGVATQGSSSGSAQVASLLATLQNSLAQAQSCVSQLIALLG